MGVVGPVVGLEGPAFSHVGATGVLIGASGVTGRIGFGALGAADGVAAPVPTAPNG